MAIKEQVELLKKSRILWNEWRAKTYNAMIDLSFADLSFIDLSGANLKLANLQNAKITTSLLSGVDFTAADLSYVDFSNSNLELSKFTLAIMTKTNLTACNLSRSEFKFSRMTEVITSNETILNATIMIGINLDNVIDLDQCQHKGRSYIDIATLERSINIPINFLRGCGLSDRYINIEVNENQLVEDYYSCFISYSHKDKSFAQTLFQTLQEHGLRCWLDEHQMLPGDDPHKSILEGINIWDKVLLCCSQNSLNSWWVDNEIESTFQKERSLQDERGEITLKLIPLDLDGYIFSPDCKNPKKNQILSRVAADFNGWENDPTKFIKQSERIIMSLKCIREGKIVPPKPKL